MLWASITALRSAKTGTAWKLPVIPSVSVSFNMQDDSPTLLQKAQNSGASALGEYLGVAEQATLFPVRVPGARSSGKLLSIRVMGDMPSLIGQPHLDKPTPFLGQDDLCFVVKPEDQTLLEGQTKEIDRILTTLYGKGLEGPAVAPRPNACLDPAGPRNAVAVSGDPLEALVNSANVAGSLKAYPVGNGVTQPVPIHRVEAEYTPEAKAAKYSGQVTVSLIVDESGTPRDVRIVKGLGTSGSPRNRELGSGLDQKAIEAVEKWRFRPGTRDGRPVSVQLTLVISFGLSMR